jgi:DNA mismatch repair protein MutS2
MSFAPGNEVIVISLNRRGEVEAVVRPGAYRVRIGGMVMTAREGELRAAAPRKSGARSPGATDQPTLSPDAPRTGTSLDLHGLTVDEARNRVAAYISRALLAGLDRVEIVHGIGTGRLKAAIRADLKQIAAVRKIAPHPGNPGVLVVYF